MLTQSDLQAIAKIIDEKLNPLEARMGSFEGKLSSLEIKLTKKISSLDKRTNRKLNMIINYFDHEDIDVRKRLN